MFEETLKNLPDIDNLMENNLFYLLTQPQYGKTSDFSEKFKHFNKK